MPLGPRLRLGVSACLIGGRVRFDGQHKRDRFLTDELGKFVEWVPVCPEVEVGMSIPRPAIRLVRRETGPRLVNSRSGEDWSERMSALAAARAEALKGAGLSGFILKSQSPTCGLERVRVYQEATPGSAATRTGVGFFAAALRARLPHLPIEEEGRLGDLDLREHFFERVFAFERLQALLRGPFAPRDLVAFHTQEKMMLLAHSEPGYRALGRLVAAAGRVPKQELARDYEAGFMTTLATRASRGRHANVLQHLAGHLRGDLAASARHELGVLIDDYRRGLVPLYAPLVLLRHHGEQLGRGYLTGQSYLGPPATEVIMRRQGAAP
jgi:uncharacterized protein YbgA (DUF1722 family)/uncharacterized protein YbbK (DUF523 family)